MGSAAERVSPRVREQLQPAGAASGVTLSHGYKALQPPRVVKSCTKNGREVTGK